jgi:tocopherol cyclase
MNPDLYHGHKKKHNFFEGWYYKIVDKEQKYSFAFIPGIIKAKGIEGNHSFIQILDGFNKKSYYLKFGINSFKADKNSFDISIDNNNFKLNSMKLNFHNHDIQILGQLKFIHSVKWPDSLVNPGSMGFYNYLTFMECYSQVCCLDGEIVGKLLINNEEIDFTGGKIYIEKNWGKRFPKAYLWLQSNSFKNPNVSFTCSIGKIPMYLFNFNGFLTAIKIDDTIYKFTTINRSKKTLKVDQDEICISFINRDMKLNVRAKIKNNDLINCKGPDIGGMSIDVKESIISEIEVELIDTYKEKLLFTGKGACSGIEMMGNLLEL